MCPGVYEITVYNCFIFKLFVSGILLITTGILYMLKTFNTKKEEEDASIEENTTYDRWVVYDIFENGFTPTFCMSHLDHDDTIT